jgi:hypothetical protein
MCVRKLPAPVALFERDDLLHTRGGEYARGAPLTNFYDYWPSLSACIHIPL